MSREQDRRVLCDAGDSRRGGCRRRRARSDTGKALCIASQVAIRQASVRNGSRSLIRRRTRRAARCANTQSATALSTIERVLSRMTIVLTGYSVYSVRSWPNRIDDRKCAQRPQRGSYPIRVYRVLEFRLFASTRRPFGCLDGQLSSGGKGRTRESSWSVGSTACVDIGYVVQRQRNVVCLQSNMVCVQSNVVCARSNVVCARSNTVCSRAIEVCSETIVVCPQAIVVGPYAVSVERY